MRVSCSCVIFFSASAPLSFQYSYITIFGYMCLIFTLLYPINYLQLSIVVYSVWWTFWVFFPEVNTWFVFTFALFSLWLLQCHAHKCLDPPPWKKKPWFVLFAFVCIAFDFSFPITSVKSLNKLWEKDVHCWFSCTTELLLTFSYLLMVHTGISKLSFPLLLLYF